MKKALSRRTILLGLSLSACTHQDGPPDCRMNPVSREGDGIFRWRVLQRCEGMQGALVTDWGSRDGRDEFVSAAGSCIQLYERCTPTQTICAPQSVTSSRIPSFTKTDIDHDGMTDFVTANHGHVQVLLGRGGHIELVEGFDPRAPGDDEPVDDSEVSIMPRPDGSSYVIAQSHTRGSFPEVASGPPPLACDASGSFELSQPAFSEAALPRLSGFVYKDGRLDALPPLATRANSNGSAVVDFDHDGFFALVVTDDGGLTDLLVDSPQGLVDKTDDLFGRYAINGMGAFVTENDELGISNISGSAVIFRYEEGRFNYGPQALNPVQRAGSMWDCHWLDIDSNGYPDMVCGAKNDPVCGSDQVPTAADVDAFVATKPAETRDAWQRYANRTIASLRELCGTVPHEIILLARGDGTYEDLRAPILDRMSSLSIGVMDAGAGQVGIVRHLTRDYVSGTSMTINALDIPGRTPGHGLNVHLSRYPFPGTEISLVCAQGNREQIWRFWEAGRQGSHQEFAHFGCGAIRNYERLSITWNGVRTDYPGGLLDRSLLCDKESCIDVDAPHD